MTKKEDNIDRIKKKLAATSKDDISELTAFVGREFINIHLSLNELKLAFLELDVVSIERAKVLVEGHNRLINSLGEFSDKLGVLFLTEKWNACIIHAKSDEADGDCDE